MEFLQWFDPVMKCLSALSGVGLVGLMLVRTNTRGEFKLMGLEHGPLFDPKMTRAGEVAAWSFGICLFLLTMRGLGQML